MNLKNIKFKYGEKISIIFIGIIILASVFFYIKKSDHVTAIKERKF